jgi:hypothetical protein
VRRSWIVGGLACALLALAPSLALGADRLYWGNQKANVLSFVALDGSASGDVPTTGATNDQPFGLALDPVAGRIYWANLQKAKISVANLDGSGNGSDLNLTGATANDLVAGVSLDLPAGRIYYGGLGKGTVSFARLDNSGGGDLNANGATHDGPAGVAVDRAGGRLWFSEFVGDKIASAGLDNSGGTNLNTTGATSASPDGIAVDREGGRVYWANFAGGKISFANLDGSGGGGDLNTTGATVSTPIGVVVDHAAGKIYWGNQGANRIGFARLDNSGGGDIPTGNATANAPVFPVLLKAPVPGGVPTVSGGSTPGSTLTCSTATWADLTAAMVFSAPRSFAFQWSLDGSGDISGATSSTFQANTPGAYHCRVTASNQAGSSSQTSDAHLVAAPTNAVTPAPGPVLPPSNHFTVGKVRRTTLSVTLDSAGTLVIVDAKASKASAAAKRKKRKKPKALLKTTTATGGPGTISVRLKLTRTAAKKLKRTRKLTVNARLTFTPNGGTPASTTAKLKCKLPRKHRKR